MVEASRDFRSYYKRHDQKATATSWKIGEMKQTKHATPMIMAHQQYWASSHNDAATDAIHPASISSSKYGSVSPFTPRHPPLQQMGCSAWKPSADENQSAS